MLTLASKLKRDEGVKSGRPPGGPSDSSHRVSIRDRLLIKDEGYYQSGKFQFEIDVPEAYNMVFVAGALYRWHGLGPYQNVKGYTLNRDEKRLYQSFFSQTPLVNHDLLNFDDPLNIDAAEHHLRDKVNIGTVSSCVEWRLWLPGFVTGSLRFPWTVPLMHHCNRFPWTVPLMHHCNRFPWTVPLMHYCNRFPWTVPLMHHCNRFPWTVPLMHHCNRFPWTVPLMHYCNRFPWTVPLMHHCNRFPWTVPLMHHCNRFPWTVPLMHHCNRFPWTVPLMHHCNRFPWTVPLMHHCNRFPWTVPLMHYCNRFPWTVSLHLFVFHIMNNSLA
ncbi:unnamed protein product [Coregonus sp. 'balchen']|nr:unnamed protein product [Coregonus sp. 'balchen']